MRLALVGDYGVSQILGGASLVDDYLLEGLRALGYQIDRYCINRESQDWDRLVYGEYTAIIYTNMGGMNAEQLVWVYSSGIPYILIRHDLPSVLYAVNNSNHATLKLLQEIVAKSKCTIFVSELQRQWYLKSLVLGPSTFLPPPIRMSGFARLMSGQRSNFLYLGPVSEARGLRDALAYVTGLGGGQSLDVFGRVEDANLAAFLECSGVRIQPEVPRIELPKLMSVYRGLVYFPQIIDAFCIKVVEAELMGLELHVNRERIGRFSYRMSAEALARYMESRSVLKISKIIDSFL